MSTCASCDAEFAPDDRYCPQCGKRIERQEVDGANMTQGAMNLSDVRFKLGMVYFKKGEYARAAEAWEKVLANNPDNVDLKRLIQDARSRLESSGA